MVPSTISMQSVASANIGQRAVFNAFETILTTATSLAPFSLYKAICGALEQESDDIKLVNYLFVLSTCNFHSCQCRVVSAPTGITMAGTRLTNVVVRTSLITCANQQLVF